MWVQLHLFLALPRVHSTQPFTHMLRILSQDLYVLRRAVGGYERLVKRFTAQTTDYQTLLSTFAEGLYTELDFRNEALNNVRMQELLDASEFAYADKVVIPKPVMNMTSRCACVSSARWLSCVAVCLWGVACGVLTNDTLPPPFLQACADHGVD